MRSARCATIALCVVWCLGIGTDYSRADVGLIIETPTGVLGFLSDVGHSSVWISHGCLSKDGEVRFCEQSQGLVLSSTAYWPNPGAAAIPAELFFLGSSPGADGMSLAAWNTSLGAAYPAVPPKYGRKYLGRVWRRAMRVTTFATTAEEDRRVLEQIEQQRRSYRYSYSHRNCAFYAQQVLQLYLGSGFHANRTFDLGVYTPRALERSLLHRLEAEPHASFHVYRFGGKLSQSWRQPPRNFCETALFDPKYALPLLMYQPYIYVGFGACYGLNRLAAATWNRPHRSPTEVGAVGLAFWHGAPASDPRLVTYRMLTGNLPPKLAGSSTPSGDEASAVELTRGRSKIPPAGTRTELTETAVQTEVPPLSGMATGAPAAPIRPKSTGVFGWPDK